MKNLTFSLLIALTVVMVVAACSPAPTPVPTAITPPEVIATSAPEPTTSSAAAGTRLTDAEMEALIAEKAHDQHTFEFILSQNKTAEEWSKTLDKMISFGAKISPDEKVMIIDWLVSRKK
jgi:ABC-type transport system substrate-binding protein